MHMRTSVFKEYGQYLSSQVNIGRANTWVGKYCLVVRVEVVGGSGSSYALLIDCTTCISNQTTLCFVYLNREENTNFDNN